MNQKKVRYDVIVVGGGAAGLMAAATAGKLGKRVLVIEVSNKLGKKILMSGGGRCNFTNLDVSAEHFICENPHFVKSALDQYSNWDFIRLVEKYSISYHEKDHGQLFCNGSSKEILALLKSECECAGVEYMLDASVTELTKSNGYELLVGSTLCKSSSVVIAAGGLSIPSLGGATGFGYQVAKQFGLSVNQTEASLVPMTLSGKWRDFSTSLSGVSLSVEVSVPTKGFHESLLFTHRGLSGPAILQLSNYWKLGESIIIDLAPGLSFEDIFVDTKKHQPKLVLTSLLNQYFAKSLVSEMQARWWPDYAQVRLHEIKDKVLIEFANRIHNWILTPAGTEGYRTAEVTRGGVDVAQISSKTMEVKHQPGLFFIGEVLDVTGHLGGYNFQWAWSSGYVAGLNA